MKKYKVLLFRQFTGTFLSLYFTTERENFAEEIKGWAAIMYPGFKCPSVSEVDKMITKLAKEP